ncbi:hypothetical protein LNQ49_18555 [Flavobacterium sp. F-65]|jgi:hypothetical protein|uniref:WD40-like Beta Propeller Repeat n=1 Tax=Flavobacterium pisciphilum TaxID=2893755 RepID=A0ABS8MXS4_9FLAO|nr:hypothetical protein [Flavobacterium sp. F-65]MCC9073583.1 hypothetical protein [Flavobacterium sp. F-65]
MKNTIYYIFGGIILVILTYVFYPEKPFEGILTNEIYLSPNGKQILYTYEKEKSSSIYSFKIGDSISTLLIKKNGWYLSEPSFSEDEQKIIYRAWQINNPVISVYVANTDGSNPKEVYKTSLLFAPKFSKYNQDVIFFVKAAEYSNHSPIVRQRPNGMDLYSYNLKTKQIQKHTDSNYYNIKSYDFIDKNKFVINSDKGIYEYYIKTLKKKELVLKNRNIDSDHVDQFYDSSLSYSQVTQKYLLSTYNQLYLWNGKNDKLEKIYTCEPENRIDYTSFFKYEDKILISIYQTITIIDYKGNILDRFRIPYPDDAKSVTNK